MYLKKYSLKKPMWLMAFFCNNNRVYVGIEILLTLASSCLLYKIK